MNWTTTCAAVAFSIPLLAAVPVSATNPYDGYMDYAALVEALEDVAAGSDACSITVIGESGQGRAIHVLTLAGDPDAADSRPAILIVGGLDGRHMIGTETAVRVASRLVEDHSDLLDQYTFYIVPRANPDGTERNFGSVNAGFVGTLTDVDADRDAMMNEDGPSDLNGDGVITQMRRPNPPLDDRAVYLADPAEPRLLKKPDADKGETAMYSVYIEGIDDDDDGQIAEDGDGFVDLDRNFMHEWQSYARDSGAYPLSEPEANALATFVLQHQNIVAAITYGRHDNLVNTPDAKGRDVTGRGPKVIDSADASLYEQIGKLYKDTTGQKRAPREDTDGSFHIWLYAQRGVPSFATVVWGRPDPTKPEIEDGEGDDAEKEPDEKPDAEAKPAPLADPVTGIWTASITVPEMGDMDLTLDLTRADDDSVTGTMDMMMGTATLTGSYAAGSGALSLNAEVTPEMIVPMSLVIDGDQLSGTVTGPEGDVIDLTGSRISDDGEADKPDGKSDTPKVADEDAAEWLAYSDNDRGGVGFIDWTEFEHPTLGTVEIGGFVPGFQMNPPADELDELAAKQAEFVVKLTDKLPSLRIEGPTVKRLAAGLYEIRLGVINDGALPTKTAMARKNRAVRPTIIRLSVPVEHIVAGDRVDRIWGLDASGGRSVHRWIVQVDDGAELTIDVLNTQLGERHIMFNAEQTPD